MQFTPKGIYTAIVTPFTEADEFDEQTFRRLIDFQVDSGAAGLLVIGGSGEFVSLTPSERQRVIDVAIDQTARRIPITLHLNYGRGISSQDARGVVQRPMSPRISTTDFYQIGASHHLRRVSFSTDFFLIDRSHEQVYVPDDGSIELKGPGRAYGYEVKTSLQVGRHLSLDGGLTKVTNAFYREPCRELMLTARPTRWPTAR